VVLEAISQLVYQPRITMEVEYDRLVGSKQTIEFPFVEPCGCSLAGCILYRSITLTKRTFRSG
jgi:hypothetical protein